MYILSTRIPIALPSVINNTRRTIGHVKPHSYNLIYILRLCLQPLANLLDMFAIS